MAISKFTNGSVVINSVDLSDHVKSFALTMGAEALDSTAMSNTTRINIGGLLTGGLTIDFEQDYASAKVDATLNALVGVATTIVLKADSGAVAATNPKWTASWILTSYQPVGGSVGDLHMTQAQFVLAGAITRAEA